MRFPLWRGGGGRGAAGPPPLPPPGRGWARRAGLFWGGGPPKRLPPRAGKKLQIRRGGVGARSFLCAQNGHLWGVGRREHGTGESQIENRKSERWEGGESEDGVTKNVVAGAGRKC